MKLPQLQDHGNADTFALGAARHALSPDEAVLMTVCAHALHVDVDRIAAVCRQTRISEEQIQLHASEIGVDRHLRPAMVENVRRFVHFFCTLEKLQVVALEGAMENRTLLGYRGITILHKQQWLSVVHFACDVLQYFGPKCSKVTVYERLLDFGYGPVKHTRRTPKTGPPKTPTEKKISMLLHTPHWTFYRDRLDRNVKRYTNAHMRPKLAPFDVLVQVALGGAQ